MDKIKPLPRDAAGKLKRTFKANGKAYHIRSAEEGIGINRLSLLYKMSATAGYGVSIRDQQKNWKKVGDLIQNWMRGKNNMEDVFALVKAQYEGIATEANREYPMTMYLCSLFIVREGEDLTTWSEAEADEKIEDWNAEGYNERDFFRCALEQLADFLNV
jgi:hypothetical protein